MVRIEVPEFYQFTQALYSGIFSSLYDPFSINVLKYDPRPESADIINFQYKIRTVFYNESLAIITEVIAIYVASLVDAVNTNSVWEIERVPVDITHYTDNYTYDGKYSNTANIEENLMNFFYYLLDALVSPDFVTALGKNISPALDTLRNIRHSYGYVGFWCDNYHAAMQLFDSTITVYGIEKTDFVVTSQTVCSPDGDIETTQDHNFAFIPSKNCLISLDTHWSCKAFMTPGDIVLLCDFTEAAQITYLDL